jgi:hypothetical protein
MVGATTNAGGKPTVTTVGGTGVAGGGGDDLQPETLSAATTAYDPGGIGLYGTLPLAVKSGNGLIAVPLYQRNV